MVKTHLAKEEQRRRAEEIEQARLAKQAEQDRKKQEKKRQQAEQIRWMEAEQFEQVSSLSQHQEDKTLQLAIGSGLSPANSLSSMSKEDTLRPSMRTQLSFQSETSSVPVVQQKVNGETGQQLSFPWKIVRRGGEWFLIGGSVLGLVSFIVLLIVYGPNANTFSNKKDVIQAYCNALVHQNYAQSYKTFESEFFNRQVTIGKMTVTSEATYERLARSIDSQKGDVMSCTMGSITQVATHSQINPAACIDSCGPPTTSITTTFAFVLKITRRGSSPYISQILVDVITDADNPLVYSIAYITTIETL